MFHWEKRGFEPMGKSVHTAEFLALGKALLCNAKTVFFQTWPHMSNTSSSNFVFP